ncbi:hypothetical protein VT50_0212315 [Streptomyces antioxidans]|uniref:Uncharacterized protein n=1 Tax=Streptomyces antioxidans TaxID=1507734 RepID=A0A1V4D793_9ACTN|nr:hypothetical protein VT50_0212315 [Streptomyces antioxidans]
MGEGRARVEGRAMRDVVSTFVQVRTLLRTDRDSPSMTRAVPGRMTRTAQQDGPPCRGAPRMGP